MSARTRYHKEAEKILLETHIVREHLVNRLAELLRKEEILQALNAHGVDNWEGYDEAMASIQEPIG